jgi:predicted DNA-binding transcriptional regulator YafY
VSTRTVLRDVEALSSAGVPVYAERGRHGGFALLPGFQTELTGLNHDEALALVVAGSRRGAQAFGLGSALASAMLKVVDALPEGHRDTAAGAARRLLVDPETDLLSRRLVTEEVPDTVVAEVRRAVFAGRRLRIHYAAVD